jgi:Bacterial PH domain
MASEDTQGVTIIAEPLARQYALTLFLLCWLFGSIVVWSVAASARVTPLWVPAGVILVVTLIWGWFRGWRMGLRIDASGLTIRNFFRTHRIGWREVARFADGSVLSLGRGNDAYAAYWALRVVLHDESQTAAGGPGRSPGRPGRRRAVTARGTMAGQFPYGEATLAGEFAGGPRTLAGESARHETLTAIKRAAERYGIPAELTGSPRLRDGFWIRLRDRRAS